MVDLRFLDLVKKCISSSANFTVEELSVTYCSHQSAHCNLPRELASTKDNSSHLISVLRTASKCVHLSLMPEARCLGWKRQPLCVYCVVIYVWMLEASRLINLGVTRKVTALFVGIT